MRIAIIGNKEEINQYYSFLIEGELDEKCQVINFDNIQQIELHDLADLFIIDSNHLDSLKVTNSLLKNNPNSKFILSFNENEAPDFFDKVNWNTSISRIKHQEGGLALIRELKKQLELLGRVKNREKQEYCKINSSYFFSSQKLACDVYIKISENKYIKLFHRFQKLTEEDIQKYNQKNVKYLFVKERDFKLIISKLTLTLEEFFFAGESPHSPSPEIAQSCQETAHEIIHKLGLNESAIKMADIAISSTIEIMQHKSKISEIWKRVATGHNYLSEHTFLISYIGSALLKNSIWYSEPSMIRICSAAFFHDIAFTDEVLAKINNFESYEFQNLRKSQKNEIRAHMQKSADLINKINGIPPDTDKIILQHHEKFDGTGFPRGIDYKTISPLAAIFIISHELVDNLYNQGFDSTTLKIQIDDFIERYDKGIFKEATCSLKKIFNTKLIESDL